MEEHLENEEIIMSLIMNGGNARSLAMSAIESASAGDFEKAKTDLKEGGAAISEAHQTQTELIQEEIRGNGTKISLLMVHAQDHMMNAMTVMDMAEQFIRLYEENAKLKELVTK